MKDFCTGEFGKPVIQCLFRVRGTGKTCGGGLGLGLVEGGEKNCFHLHDHDNTCSMYLIFSRASEDQGELACRNLVSD